MSNDLSHDDQMRVLGAQHEAARILIWVRIEIGRLNEMLRLTPEHHVRKRLAIGDRIAPLLSIARRIERAHDFPSKAKKSN